MKNHTMMPQKRYQKTWAALTAGFHFVSGTLALTAPTAAIADTSQLDPNRINVNALPGHKTDPEALCGMINDSSKQDALHKGKPLQAQCDTFSWTEDKELQTKCKLREASKNSQAVQYCEALKNSRKAQKSLKMTVALDVTASGLCLAEAFAFPAPIKGVCGFASLGAGAAEAMRLLSNGTSPGGKYEVTEDGSVEKKKAGIMGMAMGIAPVAAGLLIGKQYFSCKQDASGAAGETDKSFKETKESYQAKKKDMMDEIAHTKRQLDPLYGNDPESLANLQERLKLQQKDLKKICNKRMISFKAGIFFAGLSAMRMMNMRSAKNTEEAVLAGLAGLTGESSASAAGGITNNGNIGFSKTPTNFTPPPVQNFAITASDLDAGMPESMFLKNTPLGKKAEEVANQNGFGNGNNLENAVSSQGGTDGLVASIAGAGGAARDEALAAANSLKPYFSRGDESGSTYAGGGGGGGSSSAPASTPLNLGGLFGAEGGAAAAVGVSEEAFRSPANATSIFHENTDQNIFQIVSGKLENLQNKARIPTQAVN